MFLFNSSRRSIVPAALALIVSASGSALASSSYSEIYEDRVAKCTEIQTGKWTLKFSEPFVGDTSTFTNFSTVVVTVGDVSFTTQLGTDCKYRPGVTHARVQQVVSLPGGGGALALDVSLSWAGGVLFPDHPSVTHCIPAAPLAR
jgi:hypothetical protein